MSEATPQLRVGDTERRAVDDRLLSAVGDGVLTLSEYDERSAELWQESRTRADLDRLVADLPAPSTAVQPAAASGTRPVRVVAVMSEDRVSRPVQPGQDVVGWAVMGSAVVDLRREDLPDGTRVKVRAVMGEVQVQVPPGTDVHLTGLSVMGDRKVRVKAEGGKTLHLDAYAVMGSVSVTVGDGSVVPAAPHGGHLAHAPRAVQRAADVQRYVPTAPAPGRRKGRLAQRLAPFAVPLALVGVVASGTDGRSVFGSSDVSVPEGQDSAAVSVLFGSVRVVVPDGARIETDGLVVFGSTDCSACAVSDPGGPVVEVRRLGGFGSVEILTVTQAREEDREDDDEDADVPVDEP
ncbi:MAG: hypothetical protein JWN08_3266 [Frankiales bacterium]|nr:hypothetical protein [Frankiales bacterium]